MMVKPPVTDVVSHEDGGVRLTLGVDGGDLRLEVTSERYGTSALLDAAALESLSRMDPETIASLSSDHHDSPGSATNAPRAAGTLPRVRGVDHIGLTVPDIDEATRFFVGLLGLEEFYSHGPYVDHEGDSQTVYFDRHPRSKCLRIRMLRAANVNLELFEFESPDQVRSVPKTSDWGSAHIAFYVDDMARAVAFLRDEGVQVLGGPLPCPGPESGSDAEFCFFLTPWKQPLELISYPHGKAYERDARRRLYSPADPTTMWR